DGKLLGVIYLKDIVKGGIRERFSELRRMGIRTVMITGDNPLTAAAIAAEAGVDDFLAQATPETKLQLIRDEQAQGKLVAMCGDGSRQRSDKAHRDRRNRQAAPYDPRRADDFFDRQRCRKVFRDHPGDVRRLLSTTAKPERHEPRDAAERNPVGNYFQRPDHRRAHSPRTARRGL